MSARPYPNPDLPKLLRSLATGSDARAFGTAIIFIAAADELDYWRAAAPLETPAAINLAIDALDEALDIWKPPPGATDPGDAT